jgi:prepilin peptidase dependent protein B
MMPRRRSRGLSMVELLVGTAVGLVVTAAAAGVVGTHQRELRRSSTEARLMQDLRTTSELVARDLRRAGHWSAAASGVRIEGDAAAPIANPHASIAPMLAASSAVTLSFSNGGGDDLAVDDSERFGFRLRAGAVELQLGAGNWQAINDPATLVVTTFRVEPHVEQISLAAFCAAPCVAGSTVCPPSQQVRSFAVTIAGRSTVDTALTRALHTSVRARNDAVRGSCEG